MLVEGFWNLTAYILFSLKKELSPYFSYDDLNKLLKFEGGILLLDFFTQTLTTNISVPSAPVKNAS